MKKTISKIFACLLAASLSQFAFSFETGAMLSNNTKLANAEKDGSLKLDQKNGISMWLRTPLSQDGSNYFAGEGSFQTEYDDSIEDSDKKLMLYADLDLFKFFFKNELESGHLDLSVGRFYNSDLSSLVYGQNGDGAKILLSLPGVDLSLFGAYTGLLNAKNVTILEANDEDSPDLTDKEKNVYVLANKYLVGALTLSFPHLIASQTISVEGFGAFSLESTKYNRFYGTLALNGPILSPLFYDLTSTFGFAKYDDSDMVKGNLTKGSIIYYPPVYSMSFAVNGLYASGKQGSFDAFQGFSSFTAVNSLHEPEYTSLITAGISFSIKPLPSLLLNASGDVVFDAAEEVNQAGFQYLAGFNWQIFSDVMLGASFGQYIGKEDYEATIGENKTQIKINAVIAF